MNLIPSKDLLIAGDIEYSLFKRECPLRPIGTWHMMKNRIPSYFVHS